MKTPTLESIFVHRDPVDLTTFGTINGQKFKKPLKKCGELGDLHRLGTQIDVFNRLGGEIIRKIRFADGKIFIKAMDGSPEYEFSLDTPVYYEEWFLDRGSYLITVPGIGLGKLCTEFDPIQIA